MGRLQPVRERLRAETAGAHARVDAVYSRFDLSCAEDYGRFLQAQAAALIPLERALDDGIALDLPIDWPLRRRGQALLDDLSALGLSAPAAEPLPALETTEAALGTIYVLEGSRLGGALLKRSVSADLPTSFLGAGNSSLWQRLLQALEDLLPDERSQAAATGAAKETFDLFERSGRAMLAEAVP